MEAVGAPEEETKCFADVESPPGDLIGRGREFAGSAENWDPASARELSCVDAKINQGFCAMSRLDRIRGFVP